MATCRTCGARILWIMTKSGGKMPLDAEPSLIGNVLIKDDEAIVCNAPLLDAARASGEKLYISHFATCPQAINHRKREKGPN